MDSTSWSGTWLAPVSPWRQPSSSVNSATWSTSTDPPSCDTTAAPASNIAVAPSGVRTRSGARSPRQRRKHDLPRAFELVRSAARPHDPLPDQYVGAIFLFWNARAARLLHDDDAGVRAGKSVEHL